MDQHNNLGPDDRAFVSRSGKVLDDLAEGLSSRDQIRLAQARKAALAGKPAGSVRRWWLPVGGLVTAAVMGLALTLWMPPAGNNPGVPVMEDLELLAAAEEVDFYDELDFYLWLAVDEEPVG